MIDRFRSYFTRLEALNDAELDRSAEKLVASENQNVAKLIAHLAEMSSRKTALKLGYKNLFDYCTRRLNLSAGAIPARVHVAKVCRRFPQILAALAEGRVSLTVAALIAPHVNEDNIDTVINDCTRKTCEETKLYLVTLKPKPVFEPSIRKVPRSPDAQLKKEAPTPKKDASSQHEQAEPVEPGHPSSSGGSTGSRGTPPEPPRRRHLSWSPRSHPSSTSGSPRTNSSRTSSNDSLR